jgi:hypothetical protein
MTLSLEHRVVAHAISHLYLDEVAGKLPPHLTWQAPLVAARRGESLERVRVRMEHAGQLWLRNFDLQFSNQLILSHCDEPLSYVFQRCQRPNETHLIFGPVAVRLIESGPQPFAVPVRFAESVELDRCGS